MFKFLKKKDPIVEFWAWFEKNRAFYESLTDEELGKNLDPLYERLSAVSEGLALEMSPKLENGVRDLVISANGDVEQFPIVEQIVAAAPKFDRWTVTAFRPRLAGSTVLVSDDLVLDMAKMSFVTFDTDDEEFGVCVFAEDIKDKDQRQVYSLGLILMDNLLGEYDSVMKVKTFQFRDITDAPEDWPLRPVRELPDTVDEYHRLKNN